MKPAKPSRSSSAASSDPTGATRVLVPVLVLLEFSWSHEIASRARNQMNPGRPPDQADADQGTDLGLEPVPGPDCAMAPCCQGRPRCGRSCGPRVSIRPGLAPCRADVARVPGAPTRPSPATFLLGELPRGIQCCLARRLWRWGFTFRSGGAWLGRAAAVGGDAHDTHFPAALARFFHRWNSTT